MRLGKTTGMVSLALVFALIAVALTGCSSASNASKTPQYDLAQDGVLTVASSLDYPPFEYLDGETPTGFSIAMIQEVANRLGLACSVQKVPFDGILSSISEGGTYDVGVSSITITAKRSEQVAFSDLYYIADLAVVTRGGAYVSVADLKGKPVAARHATTGGRLRAGFTVFSKAGISPVKASPDIMDQTHFYNLIHIQLRKFIPNQHCHQSQPPTVLCHTLQPAT